MAVIDLHYSRVTYLSKGYGHPARATAAAAESFQSSRVGIVPDLNGRLPAMYSIDFKVFE